MNQRCVNRNEKNVLMRHKYIIYSPSDSYRKII